VANSLTGLAVIVLAAGQGKRMHSTLPKVLHPVAGRPMLSYVLDVAESLDPDSIIAVIGHERDQVRDFLNTRQQPLLQVVEQPTQQGTGDAILKTKEAIGRNIDKVIILNGDVPLLTSQTLERLIAFHASEHTAVAMLTVKVVNPKGYGRVVRSKGSSVLKIIEEVDATPDELEITEINAGTYITTPSFLFPALGVIQPKNAQNEYYLTDVIEVAVANGSGAAALLLADPAEVHGVNSRADLANVESVMRGRIRERVMANGVTLSNPQTAYIDHSVQIGQDVTVCPHVTLEGTTMIGDGCVIRSGVRIVDSVLGRRVTVLDSSVIAGSKIEDDAVVGPFAHLRHGTRLEQKSKVGNFVEMKKTTLGKGSKANHLTYLGDSHIGSDVNIGAGTITCNYDGEAKHETIIGDGTLIGSNSSLVAPVKIGKNAVTAAGSTITEDIDSETLGIARSKQVNKPGKVKKRKQQGK